MTTPNAPIDPREAPEFLERLRARTPGYLPGLAAPPYSPGGRCFRFPRDI